MADRLNQYPMLPNFNPALLPQQQQQLSQPQQQSQVESSQSLQGFGSDSARVWQQMQQYRPQTGTEMSSQQYAQQMADLVRSQNMARQQGQQQMNQQHHPQFGLGPIPIPSQQQSFHDQQPTQQPQSHVQQNFAGMANMQNAQMRNAMLRQQQQQQPFMGNPGSQLEMLARLQHQQQQQQQQQQQPHSGGMGMTAARMAQQQQQQATVNSQAGQNSQTPSDFFNTNDVIHSSPARSAAQPAGAIGDGPPRIHGVIRDLPEGRRHMTLYQLQQRADQVQLSIEHHERLLRDLHNQRAEMSDHDYRGKVNTLQNDVRGRKEILQKMVQAMTQLQQQGIPPHPNDVGGGGGGPPGSPGKMMGMGSSPAQSQQTVSAQSGQNPQTWMSQSGPSQPQGFANAQMNQNGTSLPQNQGQAAMSQLHGQANRLPNQTPVPPRSGPTPQQPLAAPLPTQMSPSMTNNFPFQMGSGRPGGMQQPLPQQNPPSQFMQMQMPPALEKARFEGAYTSWCNKQGLHHDPARLVIENQPIDLHALHTQVMHTGGAKMVHSNDLWSVVGGRLGFVQFPGNDSEPAKSGPVIAQQLMNIYKEHLSAFDTVYIQSVMETKRKQAAANVQQNQQGAGTTGQMNQVRPQNAQAMQQMLIYANVPPNELRARGVPDKMIAFIEQRRADLQRTAAQQQAFRGMFSKNNEQTGNPPGTFQPTLQQQQQNPSLPNPMTQPGQRTGLPITQQGPLGPNGSSIDPQFGRLSQGAPGGPNTQTRMQRPTQEQLRNAHNWIMSVKSEFTNRNIPKMAYYDLPDDQRAEFHSTLDLLHHCVSEIDSKLAMYSILMKEDEQIKKLVAIIITSQYQRTLAQETPPKYFVNLPVLRSMVGQIQHANETFRKVIHSMIASQPPNQTGPSSQSGPAPVPQRSQAPLQPIPPAIPPTIQAIPPPQPANRQVSVSNPPAQKKKLSQAPISQGLSASTSSTVSISTPPAPSASTPASNAPTPTHAAASPSTPRSPKVKTTGKPKATAPKRKISKVNPPPVESVQPPQQPQQPQQPPSAIPKRPREEEIPPHDPAVTNEASPPKKAKTSEWEGPPSEALLKQQQAIDEISTEEDASAFLNKMQALIQIAGKEGQESLPDISGILDVILKGYSSVPDLGEGSSIPLGDAPRDPSPPLTHVTAADEFIEFFDFSSFGTLDEEDGTPNTPDLISSSSTNPSPQSGSEAEAAHQHTTVDIVKIADPKLEDFSEATSDPLRLGAFREIDGGESAYYQSENWKWDGSMPALEQPWAIFTT